MKRDTGVARRPRGERALLHVMIAVTAALFAYLPLPYVEPDFVLLLRPARSFCR